MNNCSCSDQIRLGGASKKVKYGVKKVKAKSVSGLRLTLTRALRARRARPPEVPEKLPCSCSPNQVLTHAGRARRALVRAIAAARAACVSTWLGEDCAHVMVSFFFRALRAARAGERGP